MSKTRSLKMKGLSLLVALAMAVAALPLVATPALATDEPCPDHRIWVKPATQTVAPGDTVTLMQYSPAGTSTLTVVQPFDFSLTVYPTEATITQGEEVTATVTATLKAGITEEVTLNYALPEGCDN